MGVKAGAYLELLYESGQQPRVRVPVATLVPELTEDEAPQALPAITRGLQPRGKRSELYGAARSKRRRRASGASECPRHLCSLSLLNRVPFFRFFPTGCK